MDSTSLKELIKVNAIKLGFQKVGFASTQLPIQIASSNLTKWFGAGNHATMYWMEKRHEERGDIQKYFPAAKSVISLAMNYYHGQSSDVIKGDYRFSNYAWGDDYHDIIKKKLYLLGQVIRDHYPEAKIIACNDTSPVMEKVWAQRAGLGWQGKHTNLITRDYGSWVFLGELITDIKIDPDLPFVDDLCGSCTACIDACPTQALEPYGLDARKCISYLTIEHRGELPLEHKHKLDGWIFGCDACQDVCPWNKKFTQSSIEQAFKPRTDIVNKSLENWSELTEEEFRVTFKNSPVKRTKYAGLLRNIEANINK